MNNRDHILTEVVRWLEDYNYLEEVLQENADFAFAQFEVPKGPDRAKKAAMQARDIIGLNKKEPIVQSAIQHDEITMSRGAEILGLDLEDMRDRVFAWD